MTGPPQTTAPCSEEWATWRGSVTAELNANTKTIEEKSKADKEMLKEIGDDLKEAVKDLRSDFADVVGGKVQCHVGRRVERLQGRAWKAIALALVSILISIIGCLFAKWAVVEAALNK